MNSVQNARPNAPTPRPQAVIPSPGTIAVGDGVEEAEEGEEVTAGLERLLAEKKANGTRVPAFFALYPMPIHKGAERGFVDLLPVLEKYFDEHILVSKGS